MKSNTEKFIQVKGYTRKYRERKLYEAVIDPSHYVRNHILQLCKDGSVNDAEIAAKLVEMLRNDANYAIRSFADMK